MAEKLFEIKFSKTISLSPQSRKAVESQVAESKLEGYQGFAKAIIKTGSLPREDSVEPIRGTIVGYLDNVR